jgi:hypothetical protein
VTTTVFDISKSSGGVKGKKRAGKKKQKIEDVLGMVHIQAKMLEANFLFSP